MTKHNPGVPTRAMAMMNGSIYDIFQAVNRTHAPFKVNTFAPGASVDAAVSQAAYRVLSDMYPEMQASLDSTRWRRDSATSTWSGERLRASTSATTSPNNTSTAHQNDGWDLPDAYTPTVGPGHWSTDPMVAPNIQKGWGSDWGSVHPWAMPNPDYFDSATPFTQTDLNSQRYTDAFNEVKAYGSRNSVDAHGGSNGDRTFLGLRSAGHRRAAGLVHRKHGRNRQRRSVTRPPTMRACSPWPRCHWRMQSLPAGTRSTKSISGGQLPEFAERPTTATRTRRRIQAWEYLGAPGNNHAIATDDFTPPFPSYISGHATMGGAIFKSLELFYGTNDFDVADASIGVDPVTGQYTLHSVEEGGGGARDL